MRTDNPDEDVDPSTADADRSPDAIRADRAELEHRLERLSARNERLRDEIDRSRRTRLRLAALGFVGLGLLSFGAAFVAPDGQNVLFALAGVGLFGGLLTRSVTGSRFVESGDAERVYATCATNYETLLASRDLGGDRYYLPNADGRVRLFVPADSERGPPSLEARRIGLDEQGFAVEPIGTDFVREVEGAVSEAATTPTATVERLTDALEARFEFATDVDSVVDVEAGRAEVAVTGSAFGAVDRFDHPVASILGVGLADVLERPVRVDVTDETERGEWLVRCEWETDAESESGSEGGSDGDETEN